MAAPQIAVIGSGCQDARLERLAEEVGRRLGEHGCVLVCGGHGGVMEAAARGARSVGGTTIGILPGESRLEANPWIEHSIATGIGQARNLAVVASGDAVIAIGGEWGTLSEIGLARKLGRSVILLAPSQRIGGNGIFEVATPEEAVEKALELAVR